MQNVEKGRRGRDDSMQAGQYRFDCSDVVAQRAYAIATLNEYEQIAPDDLQRRERFLRKNLFGALGDHADVRHGFKCDRGSNLFAGKNLVIDFDCTILDAAPVIIGDWVIIGPHVLISTVTHPLSAMGRREKQALAAPVRIGNDVWIGGSATVLPGVTIGDNVVIGAGAVVTKDIPPNSLALGVPARVVRTLENDVFPEAK